MHDKKDPQPTKAERIAELNRLQHVVADAHQQLRRRRYQEDVRQSTARLKDRMRRTDLMIPDRWSL